LGYFAELESSWPFCRLIPRTDGVSGVNG
jgi:hypothetical protein